MNLSLFIQGRGVSLFIQGRGVSLFIQGRGVSLFIQGRGGEESGTQLNKCVATTTVSADNIIAPLMNRPVEQKLWCSHTHTLPWAVFVTRDNSHDAAGRNARLPGNSIPEQCSIRTYCDCQEGLSLCARCGSNYNLKQKPD